MIPAAPLTLGLAGLLPFLFAAALMLSPTIREFAGLAEGSGRIILHLYGTIILSFMSGTIWGFATRTHGAPAGVFYVLSVIPALWAFFCLIPQLGFDPALPLAIGFVALLPIDWAAWRQGLAPEWWMRLRLLLTAVVVPCLLVSLI